MKPYCYELFERSKRLTNLAVNHAASNIQKKLIEINKSFMSDCDKHKKLLNSNAPLVWLKG